MRKCFDYGRTVNDGPDIARIGALIGDPARATMLTALMSGKALTASELAQDAGVTIQTAGSHLSTLDTGGLLRPRKQGRHKYFSLASDDLARVPEGMMRLAAGSGHLGKRTELKDAALCQAHVCYNHLAGDMSTQMFDSLIAQERLILEGEELKLTASGATFVKDLQIDLVALRADRAPLCRDCLDWSERRSPLAGSLGRAFLSRFETLGRTRRDPKSRIVSFSQNGISEFERLFE